MVVGVPAPTTSTVCIPQLKLEKSYEAVLSKLFYDITFCVSKICVDVQTPAFIPTTHS